MIAAFLQRLARLLAAHRIPYMIIGGQAVLYYGSPRLTQDVDITLGVDTDAYERLARFCRATKLTPLVKHPDAFAHETHVLPVTDAVTGVRVDFIFSNTPYERQAIRRARRVRSGTTTLHLTTVDDLIVHKLVAGRPVDVDDVRVMLAKQARHIHPAYVRRWLKAFEATGAVTTSPLATFERLRRATA